MITVTPNGQFKHGFRIAGHAGYAERGSDIVCAAVSVLAQTIAKEIEQMDSGEITVSDGYIEVSNYVGGYTERIIDMMVRSLREIQMQYPHHIKIEREETQ